MSHTTEKLVNELIQLQRRDIFQKNKLDYDTRRSIRKTSAIGETATTVYIADKKFTGSSQTILQRYKKPQVSSRKRYTQFEPQDDLFTRN
jgi:hypothetical protein